MANESLKHGDFKWSIVKSYYSMFHYAKAVLFQMGLKERSHTVIGEVLEILHIEGKLESRFVNDFYAAMDAREGADYHYKHPEMTAEVLIELAEEFTGEINMTEETPQQAARYTSFGHDFQKLVAASSGVSNPVFEMKLLLKRIQKSLL